MNFSAKIKVSAKTPPLRQAAETLGWHFENPTLKTECIIYLYQPIKTIGKEAHLK